MTDSRSSWRARGLLVLALLWLATSARTPAAQSQPAAPVDGITTLLRRVEATIASGKPDDFMALVSPTANQPLAREFAESQLGPGVTRAVVVERDRASLLGTLPGDGYALVVETLHEKGERARIATWRLDVRRLGADEWHIVGQEALTFVQGLHRLALNPKKQLRVHNLRLIAEDFEATMAEGSAFVAETADGVAAVVLVGKGEMHFTPSPAAEKIQVRLFVGTEDLRARFDVALIRMNPVDLEDHFSPGALTDQAFDGRLFSRAETFFRDRAPTAFSLDLSDLSREPWSLLPSTGDFLADVRTEKQGILTYTRSGAEAEDISLFDRRRKRTISAYSSKLRVAVRGASFNEDAEADYDVRDYQVDSTFSPDREWIDGRTRISLRVRAYALATMTFRLADSLAIRSVYSDRYGRLTSLRVRNQHSFIVNLPAAAPRDAEFSITVEYAGRLPAQSIEREAIALQDRADASQDVPIVQPEPSYLYTNRGYWYAQAPASDFATATLRLTVPQTYDVVASGELANGYPMSAAPDGRKVFLFEAKQPLRYLACVISRFVRVQSLTLPMVPPLATMNLLLSDARAMVTPELRVRIEANPRQRSRARQMSERMTSLIEYFTSLVGEYPYPSLTLALVESHIPGGHSPGYFASLNQPLPSSPFVWRNDPVHFTSYPYFFLAHELAHQWWGQAVGWRNYHEQWLSEGFAQYFAALAVEREKGDEGLTEVLRQFRRWSIDTSDQGPVYLGYRLGHIRGEPKVFRALVYNKGALVLHMLRRLVGDEAFFRGLRRFYTEQRFRKASTDDFRRAMEKEADRPLQRFFDRWIYGASIPRIDVNYRTEAGPNGPELIVAFDQKGDEIFDIAVTVTVEYADGSTAHVVVPVTEAHVEHREPLREPAKNVFINRDEAALARFTVKGR